MDPFTLDDSGDELDTLSQDTTDDPIHYGKKVQKDDFGPRSGIGSRTGQAGGIGQVSAGGERLPTEDVIKKLKFKKNKTATNSLAAGSQRLEASSSQLSVLALGDGGHAPARNIPKPSECSLSRTSSLPSQPSRQRKRSPSPVRRVRQSQSKDGVTARGNSENTRPKPRPIGNSRAAGLGKKLPPPSPKETATPLTVKKPVYADRLKNSFSPSQLPNNTPTRPNELAPTASLGPRAKEGIVPLPRKKALLDKAKTTEKFPMLSPLSSQVTGSGEGSGKKIRTWKASQRVILSEDDDADAEVETGPAPLKPQPFPMSTQHFAHIGSSSVAVPPGQETKRKGKGRNGIKAQPFPMSAGVLESIGSSPTTSSGGGSNRVDVQPFPMSSQDLFGDGSPPSAGLSFSRPFTGIDNQQERRKDLDA